MWQIATATGWKFHYIMWGLNWQTLLMAISDHTPYGKKQKKTTGDDAPESGAPQDPDADPEVDNDVLNFFQSQQGK